MNVAAQAEHNLGLPARRSAATSYEARRWITRQLEWERTLDALRGHRRAKRVHHNRAA